MPHTYTHLAENTCLQRILVWPLRLVKIFSNEQEMQAKCAQNATNGGLDSPKLVWWPGSAQTRWGSLQRSPRPPSWI